MHNAMTHWLCFRARASLARGATVLAARLLVASAAYGQSASVTKVEAFSPHTAGVYCQGTTCWVTRGKSVLVRAFGTGITQATHVTDGSTNLSSSLTGMKQIGTPGWVEVQLAPSTSAARGNDATVARRRRPWQRRQRGRYEVCRHRRFHNGSATGDRSEGRRCPASRRVAVLRRDDTGKTVAESNETNKTGSLRVADVQQPCSF